MPRVWEQFKAEGIPSELVDKLQTSYTELKEAYYLGKHKPSELEGGHIAELVLRILQWATGGTSTGQPYSPLGQQLPRFDHELKRLEGLSGSYSKTLRVHIPRVLLSMYDIRNSRGVGHPSGDVDPNLSDATLIVTAADWVVAELLRIYHHVSLNEAQAIVHGLVERRVPVVEMFGDFPKVLRTDLSNPTRVLLILYVRGEARASAGQLGTWLRIPSKETRRILRRHDESALVHYDDGSDTAQITRSGIAHVEVRVNPAHAV